MHIVPLLIFVHVQTRWFLHNFKRFLEVVHWDRVRQNHFLFWTGLEFAWFWLRLSNIDSLELEEKLPQGTHCCLLADQSDVWAWVAFQPAANDIVVNIRSRPVTQKFLHHVFPGRLVGKINKNLNIFSLTLFSSLLSMASSRSQGILLAAKTKTD